MTVSMVRSLVYAIAMSALYGVIEYLNHRKAGVNGRTQHDTQYVVRVPSALRYVYMTMFLLGTGLFLVFLIFKVNGNDSVTMGHLYFSLVFAGIGLLVMIWASRWSILVTDSKMEIHRLFHKKAELSIEDIGKTERTKKNAIILYDRSRKKLITIDSLSENYDRFARSLRLNEKTK